MRQALRLHPDSRCSAATGVKVDVARPRGDSLVLRFFVTGKISALRMPLVTAPERADELWQHTCFEAFVGAMGTAGYSEFNFSPSTQWAAYRFTAYREGMAALDAAQFPRISVRRDADRLTLDASIDLGPLQLLNDIRDARLALSTVIEDADRILSYWAIAHPPGKPDFHHADCFTLEVP